MIVGDIEARKDGLGRNSAKGFVRAHGLSAVYDVEMRLNFSKKRQSFTISSDREAM